MTISFLVIFSLCTRLDRVIRVVGLVVAMSAGINLIQYYLPQLLPVTFHTHVPGRAAGFAEDPNEFAAYICLALPLVAFFARRPVRYMWYVIALAGVAVTFSRGGIVLWVTAVVVTEALKQRERGPFCSLDWSRSPLNSYLLRWSSLVPPASGVTYPRSSPISMTTRAPV